jgi:SlyX protein
MIEARLTELEVKLAFQDELLDTLNLTVSRQQKQIELLQQQLRVLYQQVRGGDQGNDEPTLLHEMPPHY